MRIAGYMRVSAKGDRDPDRWLTVPQQRETIERWCSDNGHTLVDMREDIDQSGGRERVNLEALVARIEAGELDALVVAKLDRFSRSMPLGIKTIERIDKAGGTFIAAAGGFDLRTDEGRFAFHNMLSMADYELRRFKTGWQRTREAMIKQGRFTAPSVPLGYRRNQDGILEPDPETAELVVTLFERRAAGESPSVLARWLQELGIRTSRNGIPNRRYVRELLTNRTYLGEVRAGSLVNENAHTALLSRNLFEAVQGIRGARPKRSTGTGAALAGVLRCAGCRYVLSPTWSKHTEGQIRAYRCRKHHSAGTCPAPAFVLEASILPLIEDAFWQRIEAMEAKSVRDIKLLDKLTDERDQAWRDFQTYRDDPAIISALGPRDYADGLSVRRERRDQTNQRLLDLLAEQGSQIRPSHELKRDWPEIDLDTKRRMYLQVFDAIVIAKPQKHRDHSSPLADRTSFLLSGSGMSLPKPGACPSELTAFDVGKPSRSWLALS